jgi:putative sterol carrier protein
MARVTSVQTVFDAMPDHFRAEQAPNTNAVVQFDLSGPEGGQYYASIANGALTTAPGQAPNPDVTLMAAATDFLALINGELNPMSAFMQGRIRVKGDMALLMRLQSIFSR